MSREENHQALQCETRREPGDESSTCILIQQAAFYIRRACCAQNVLTWAERLGYKCEPVLATTIVTNYIPTLPLAA